MNRSFRLVWNAAQASWVVASEFAKGKTKSKALKASAVGMFTAGLMAVAPMSLAAPAVTNWTGAVDNDWSTAGNWDNGVPTSNITTIIDGFKPNSHVDSKVLSFNIGSSGTGSLKIINGAALNINDVHLGNGQDALGTLTLDGGRAEGMYHLRIGYTGNGILNVLNGGSIETPKLIFGTHGVMNIGAEAGSIATKAGDLEVTTITFSSGINTLVLNHTDSDYVISSNIFGGSDSDNINLLAGTTSFGGDLSGYTGKMTVDGGTLRIADGDTLTLGGDYTQTSGILQIGASSAASYGKLNVAARPAQPATVNLMWRAPQTLQPIRISMWMW